MSVEPGYLDSSKVWRTTSTEAIERVMALLRNENAEGPTVMRVGQTPLPVGYHRQADGHLLIVSPNECPSPPLDRWGWSIQLYSLRSQRSWGIGDFGDLKVFARWAKSLGAAMVLVNPLLAPIAKLPQQTSPYFPSSRSFLNPIYIAIDLVESAVALPQELVEAGRRLNDLPLIDRDAIFDLKMRALRMIWERFEGDPDFDSFCNEHGPTLIEFARFCDPSAVELHSWLQWLADTQLADARSELEVILDVAVGVDPAGFDARFSNDVFAKGVSVGAPPDRFNTKGQNWSLLPIDPLALRNAEYEPFIQMLRRSMRGGGGVRIDHVMGLFRLWWIPEGSSPADGAYVRYPAEDLLAILTLEAHLAGAYVVGEDLGTVEEHVRAELSKRNVLSYRLMFFNGPEPAAYPRLSLATVSTHDLPTIAGLWTGSDLEEQRRLDLAPNVFETLRMRDMLSRLTMADESTSVAEIVLRTYQRLAEVDSALVAASLEDVLGVERRVNIPGTRTERPNWSIPLPLTLERIMSDARVLEVAKTLSQARP